MLAVPCQSSTHSHSKRSGSKICHAQLLSSLPSPPSDRCPSGEGLPFPLLIQARWAEPLATRHQRCTPRQPSARGMLSPRSQRGSQGDWLPEAGGYHPKEGAALHFRTRLVSLSSSKRGVWEEEPRIVPCVLNPSMTTSI